MTAVLAPDEEESYLLAILDSPDGLDLAEFVWYDPESSDGCYRAWDFQWSWYTCGDMYQVDQGGRACGKTVSITMRAFALPFAFPGSKMLLTAPELNHLRPLTDAIEDRLMGSWLMRQMLPDTKGHGMTRQPHWMCKFNNQAQIVSRLPNKDGKGVKGQHVMFIELDEAQDYPLAGWIEVVETLNRFQPGAMWRCHGVPKGVRDKFFEMTEGAGDEDRKWCLPAGTLVYGVDGPFPIEKAVIGTAVWSLDPRTGQLQQDAVTDVLDNGIKPTWKVRAKGGMSLETTTNHPYLILSREGTRRTRRALRFQWVDAQDVRVGDYIVGVRELDSTGTQEPAAEDILHMLADHSPMREVPAWVWKASRVTQLAFLAGYAMGDGSRSRQVAGQDALAFATASVKMARQLRALCHYLGLRPTALAYEDRSAQLVSGTGDYWKFYAYVDEAWFWQVPQSYSSVRDGEMLQGLDKRLVARKVTASGSSGEVKHTYDITVGDRHNYIAEGVVVHNTVHRPMGMNRPTWSKEERNEKMKEYGGSRQNIDYKRNIYGEHGDASNSVFVLARLMDCVDTDEGSVYNQDIYKHVQLEFERLPQGPSITDEVRQQSLLSMIDIPGSHLHGYSQIVDRREVGSPKGYSAYWGGADVGVTNHPSEFLVFGQRMGTDVLELLLRINLQRINTDDQKYVIEHIFKFYGPKLKVFGLDKTGVGFPIWDQLTRYPEIGDRIRGYNFSEKVPVAFLDRALERGEKMEDLAIWRNVVEATTDFLRNDYVDAKKIRLPYDREILLEFQGQTYCCDTQTEILTRRGWLRYDEVRAGDEALGLAADMQAGWTAITDVNVFPAIPREMVWMSGQAHESYTTANHRWLGKPYHHAKEAVWRESEGLLAEGVNFRIPLVGRPANGSAKYDDDFVELVAWYFTEGHLVPGGKLGLSQSPTANPAHVARIEALLVRLLGQGNRDIGRGRRGAGRWSVTTTKRQGGANTYVVLDRELAGAVFDVTDSEKVVAPEFICALTLDQLRLFIDVALLGDGCEFTRERVGRRASTVRTFIQQHRGRSDAFQMACALAGQAQQTSERDGRFVTTLLRRQGAHASSLRREKLVDAVEVWCPTTDTGTWLARRNGRVFFTGNTVIKDTGNPYGQRRLFGGGSFHTLDAAKMVMAGRVLPPILAQLENMRPRGPVLDVFVGA